MREITSMKPEFMTASLELVEQVFTEHENAEEGKLVRRLVEEIRSKEYYLPELELLMLVDKLPSVPDPQNTASAIFEIHQKLKLFTPLLGITVSYNTIDRVSEALIILEANVRTGDSMQYAATLSLLRDLIEELSRLEKISVENILWLTPPVLGVSHFV